MMSEQTGPGGQTNFVLPADQSPVRLDVALGLGFALGRRQARDCIAARQVWLDGRRARKGDLVQPGQCVTVQRAQTTEPATDAASAPRVCLVARSDLFAALNKPIQMHSVRGRGAVCVEAGLDHLGLSGWTLVNRLDFLTSGLVLAAATTQAREHYVQWQDQGLVHKWYLAWASGQVQPMTLQGRILDHQRRTVRVTDEHDLPVRWTKVRPLLQRTDATLVLVHIAKGRRHQIRAHLASAGHPLLGDPVYGSGGEEMFLHHCRVELPGFTAGSYPEWADVDPSSLF